MFDVDYNELRKKWNPDAERCGLILLDGTILELPNIHPDPVNAYEMDAQDFLDKAWATWHTHPRTSGNLSSEDYLNFCMPPADELVHFIVDSREVWRYYWEDKRLLLDDHDSTSRLHEDAAPE